MTGDEARGLRESFDRLSDKIELVMQASMNQSQVVHTDGKGVHICVTACIVMLVIGIMGMMWMGREFSRQDSLNAQFQDSDERANTYLSSIFGRVPDLKKAVEADYELRQKMKGEANAQR